MLKLAASNRSLWDYLFSNQRKWLPPKLGFLTHTDASSPTCCGCRELSLATAGHLYLALLWGPGLPLSPREGEALALALAPRVGED